METKFDDSIHSNKRLHRQNAAQYSENQPNVKDNKRLAFTISKATEIYIVFNKLNIV